MYHLVRSLSKPLLRPLRPLIYREFNSRISRFTKQVSITETNSNDIFIAGYPKSGNTWMQNLIAGLVFGMDMRYVPDSLVQSLVPDVHPTHFYRRHLTPTFFKTHHLPRPEYRRVIYLVRDGRDVMVSYFHYLAGMNGTPPDFQRLVTSGEGLFPCRWHEHIDAWMTNPFNAQMLTISYEALKKHPVGELQKICEFAGLDRPRSILEVAVRTSSFGAMRDRERRFGLSFDWPKDKSFVRRGKVRSFQDEMPVPVLEAFMTQSERALKRLGYVSE